MSAAAFAVVKPFVRQYANNYNGQQLPPFTTTMMRQWNPLAASNFFDIPNLSVAIDGTAPETVDTTMAATNFEPVLDVSALGTFLFISIIFAALNFRTSQVEKTVQDRNYWLEQVRDLKSKELAGETVEESVLNNALAKYESAVVKEEKLRNLVPGVVRIVPPSASSEADAKAAAMAKQFLGKEYDIGTSSPQKDGNGDGKLPTTALAVLAVIFFAQLGLLVFMNFSDPMSGGSIM